MDLEAGEAKYDIGGRALTREIEKQIKQKREQETQQEKTKCLSDNRERQRERRAQETQQETTQHLIDQQEIEIRREGLKRHSKKQLNISEIKERDCGRRAQEKQQERTQRLRDQRERQRERRAQETGDERTERLDEQRDRDIRQRNARLTRRNLSADVGEMTSVYPQCRAYHFSRETTNFCCMKGKVIIAPLKTLPNALINLYTGDTPQAHEFRKDIRQYNCLFQLTSFGAKEVVAHGWNPSVIIQSQIHHFISSLMPDLDQQSKFLQIYFMDPQDSIEFE
ncbi:RNA-binding protein 25-like [Amblyraja radiata]|uniref:RNA-binding protein 25-like n=1 Tax=Amblyraja radiata TaxID=386614 RepID=UPI001403BB4F|nr:RNA-binding protein 25-like [Amblyraja radiata]